MQFKFASLLAFTLGAIQVAAQQVGQYDTETHPSLPIQTCTKSGCTTVQTKISLDSNWRWTHKVGDYKNCYDGNEWDTSVCSSGEACAKNCAVEGVKYSETYGITTSGNSLSLKFVTKHQYGTNVGSRVYLMASSDKYYMFKLLNKEFTFDVDVSKLPCGLNGALYFVQMDEDGGKSRFPNNKAGAKYGTGYCDAQCPHDMKWINGEGNVDGWAPSDLDPNAGKGKYGTCCDEMDIWEANSMATAYTPHSCSTTKQERCSGTECGDNGPDRYLGVCDKDGCDFNSYRMGDTSFYGKGKTVNTNSKMTVVTQFITDNGQASGNLKEIRRIYKQNGQVIQNSKVNIDGMEPYDSITTEFCDAAKTAFNDNPHFQTLGGMKKMGDSLRAGHVLALSIWDDYYAQMLWLDSAYPLDRDENEPGIKRGECPRDSGKPSDVEKNSPDATVTFSNIKVGDLDTTY